MEYIAYFVEMGLIAFAGVYLGCRLMRHDIPLKQQAVAAGGFALLYAIPIAVPVVRHLLPAVALYLGLVYRTEGHGIPIKVFLFTWVFAFLVTALLVAIRQGF